MANEIRCKACGRMIRFIKTTKGLSMPVDARGRSFVPDMAGKFKYVTEDGSVLSGVPAQDGDPDIHEGYISHFATCTNPDYFRNRKPRKKERKEAQK